MDSTVQVEFDIHGTNPVNTFKGEKAPLTDKSLNWVIPNASPFFGEVDLVNVYNDKGQQLILNRDYFLEEEFQPFVKASGRQIVCFIRLSDPVVLQNDFVTFDYQSIGAWFVPRNSLQQWLDQIYSGGVTPIPWSMVFNVPPTLPSCYHSHSVYTEIGDWFELTFFFEQLEGIRRTRDPDVSAKLTQAVNAAYTALNTARDQQIEALSAHDRNYSNPHVLDKTVIGGGNLDNFATATPAEDLAGVRNDVFSTPYGLTQLAMSMTPDTSKAMFSGILPISQFGGGSYIPPGISGSFEGMGTETECSAICLEPDGSLMILSNHFDGRTRGLYFSNIKDYNTANPKHTFTNYRYDPPSLASAGVVLNRVVMGSGGKVILTGVTGDPNWFIALTNGTLDPSGHRYVRCDMTAVVNYLNDPKAPGYSSSYMGALHHMGAYIVLVHTFNTNTSGSVNINAPGRQVFFRVKTADIIAGNNVVWEHFNVTYNNFDGVLVSNQPYMETVTPTVSGGLWTRLGPVTVSPEFTVFSNDRRIVSLSSPKTGNLSVFNFTLLSLYHFVYNRGANNLSMNAIIELDYDLNPSTGVLVLKSKTPAVSYDFFNPTPEPASKYSYLSLALTANSRPSTVLLDTGEIVSSIIPETAVGFPIWSLISKLTGRDTPESVLSNKLDLDSATLQYQWTIDPVISSPLLSGTYGAGVVYDVGGEIYGAVNQETHQREVYFRQVTGPYQINSSVKNLNIGDINARPLSNAVFRTNLLHHDPVISLTGGGPELGAAGVDCGNASLSCCAYSSNYPVSLASPQNPALRIPGGGNVLISFPRTYTKTLDTVNKVASYSGATFYGLRQNVIDLLHAYVPTVNAGTRGWCFTLNMLGSETGGVFNGLNLAVIQIAWENELTLYGRIQLLLVRPIVEAPNSDHPGVYLITGFQVLHAPANVRASHDELTTSSANSPVTQFDSFSEITAVPERPMMIGYKSGTSIKMQMFGAFFTNLGYPAPLCNIFDLNLATNTLDNIASGAVRLGSGNYVAMIPMVGMTDCGLVVNSPETTDIIPYAFGPYINTGGGAEIFTKTGVGSYLTVSAYPEAGWMIYFQDGIRLLINGSNYTVPGGSIDLRDIDPAPQNKTFYVYVTVEDDQPQYVISAIALRKTNAFMRAATVVTNAQQILSITREQPFMIADMLLSYTREGGIIPVSTGFPQDPGQFVFLSQSELLP